MQKIIPITLMNEPNKFLSSSIDRTEIEFLLTTDCNLQCDFCCVVYNKQLKAKLSKERVLHQLDLAKQIINQSLKDHIAFTLYGGELFQDKYTDNQIDLYYFLVNELVQYCKNKSKQYSFSLMTNACYHKVDRLINFVKTYPFIDTHISYDFKYRFTKDYQSKLVIQNLKALLAHSIQPTVSIVTFKSNINKILNHDPIWLWLYDLFKIHFSLYDNTQTLKGESATPKELTEFYMFLVKNYPKVIDIEELKDAFNSQQKRLNCARAIKIDNTAHYCCDDRFAKEISYLQNHACMQCGYYSFCPMTCIRQFNQMHTCFIKPIFEYYGNIRT